MAINVSLPQSEICEQVKTDELGALRKDIAQGLNDVKNGQVGEIDFDSLKQQGRCLMGRTTLP